MSDVPRHPHPVSGRCLCGAVRITLDRAGTPIDVCHCTMCRAWGGPFMSVSAESYTVEGEDRVVAYRSSEWAERAFCGTCGSNLWYDFLPAGQRSFLAGLFELPEGFALREQIFIDEKPGWYDLAQQTVMKSGAQVIAEAREMGYAFD